MSVEGGGTGLIGACATAAFGVVAMGGIVVLGAITGTCLLAAKGLQMGAQAAHRAVKREMQRRKADEERYQQSLHEALSQLKHGLEALNRGAAQEEFAATQEILNPVQERITIGREKSVFLRRRSQQLREKAAAITQSEAAGMGPLEGAEGENLIANYLLQIEETEGRAMAIERQTQVEEEWLRSCRGLLDRISMRQGDQPQQVRTEEVEALLKASPLPQPLGQEQQALLQEQAELDRFYETCITDTLLGSYLLSDPRGLQLKRNLDELNRSVQEGAVQAARQLIRESRKLSRSILEEFSRKYASLWGKYVSETAKEVLAEMGYTTHLHIATPREGVKKVYGYQGAAGFEFVYNEETGGLEFKLDHDAFESQDACNQEAKRFMDAMAARGIIIELSNFRQTRVPDVVTETNPQEISIVDRIVSAVQAKGWDCHVEEEGDSVTVTVRRGYQETTQRVDKEYGLTAVKQLIDSIEAEASRHGQTHHQ